MSKCKDCKYANTETNNCNMPLLCVNHRYFVQRVEKPSNTRFDKHHALCAELHKLYKAKDDDYGSSFSKTRAKYNDSILIRLNDKLNRLETLYSGKAPNITDEKIDDTLMDMAGYCILELVERGMEGK